MCLIRAYLIALLWRFQTCLSIGRNCPHVHKVFPCASTASNTTSPGTLQPTVKA